MTLMVEFRTGGDDLRGGNDNVHLYVILRGEDTLRFENVNDLGTWTNNSVHTVLRPLPASLSVEDIVGVRLETTFGGGIGGDNWKLDGITVRTQLHGETRTLLDRRGSPLFYFTGEQRVHEFRIWSPGPFGTKPLDLFWNASLEDNFSTATDLGRRDARAAEHRFARTEGFILSSVRPASAPITTFWSEARGDYFLTATDDGRSDAEAAGYQLVRSEGAVFTGQEPGTVPLDLYWSEARGDYFTTATFTGRQAAGCAGYRFVRTEGFVYPSRIALRAHNGQYVGAAGGGGSTVDAGRDWIREHEMFEVIYAGGNIALRTYVGYAVSLAVGTRRELIADRLAGAGPWDTFRVVEVAGSKIGLRTVEGRFVSAEDGGGRELVADRTNLEAWETFELISV